MLYKQVWQSNNKSEFLVKIGKISCTTLLQCFLLNVVCFPSNESNGLLPVQCTKDRPREYATNSCYGVHLDLKSSHDWCALRTYSPAKSLPSGHHDLGSMVSGTPNSKCGGVEIRSETTNMTISLKPPLPSHTSFILTDLCAHQSRCNQEASYFRREHAGANSLWNLRKINQFQATRIDVEYAFR